MLFAELTLILDSEPHDASLNMAIDEALFHSASTPLLRLYQWIRPSTSFGYFGKFESVARESGGREIVRRWTGGGVVLHGEDVTYTLIAPSSCAVSRLLPKKSYRVIHECIAAHLSRAGQQVKLAGAANPGVKIPATTCGAGILPAPTLDPETTSKISDACFENPVPFDLIAGGMKIAGAAQRRAKGGLLHQGSIHCRGVSRASCDGLAEAFASRIIRRDLLPGDLESAHVLAAEKYATDAWLKKF